MLAARPSPPSTAIPAQAGIGLRFPHHREILDTRPDIAWLEIHTENYLGGGAPRADLERIRTDYPLSLHGVGLSLGSADGLDTGHLARIRELMRRIEPGLISEHLSWSRVAGVYLPDLLPLPLTEEALDLICDHIDQTQIALGRAILLENPSSYLRYTHSTIPEWAFLSEIVRRTGCGLLCDVNNIHVSAANHGWDPRAYMEALPAQAIGEIHLAGHSVRQLDDGQVIRIDDHGSRVIADVWSLYEATLARSGAVPTLVEWDNDIPPLSVLLDEARLAQTRLIQVQHANAA